MTIRFLTGATGAYLEDGTQWKYGVGLLIQPGNAYRDRLKRYPVWAADNGRYTKKPLEWDANKFRAMLWDPRLRDAIDTCLFVAAPDRILVGPDGQPIGGDARGTLEDFPAWAAEIRALGYPVAFIAQNGLEDMLDEVPWDELDVMFIGGTTEWKLGDGARKVLEEAKRRGKGTHVGRVNTKNRMVLLDGWGVVDTIDGTKLAFGPKVNLPQLTRWLGEINGPDAFPQTGDVEEIA